MYWYSVLRDRPVRASTCGRRRMMGVLVVPCLMRVCSRGGGRPAVTVAVEKRQAFAGIRIRAEKCRDAMQLVGSRSHQAVPIGRRRKTRVMAPASVRRRCPQCGCA